MMNERIRKLAEQVGLEYQPAKLKIFKNDDGTVTSGGWEYPLEKFAELIVQECVRVVYQCSSADCYSGDEFVHAGNTIKQHFGIE